MNAAVTKRQTGRFLPEITPKSNKRRKGTHYSRMKQEDSLGSGSSPLISRGEISQFRNSPKQNICVQLLREGYPRAFSEIFSLLAADRDRRDAAEPGSDLRLQTPLDRQLDKLETMKRHLSRAEEAERTCSWMVVCDQRLMLGWYFSAPEDLWLSLHFFHSCTDREQGSHSRPATEARVCMAETYLKLGELERARQQAELCLQQVEDAGWADSDGRPLRLRACEALWRIYSRLADAPLEAADHDQGLKLLYKGYGMATECRYTSQYTRAYEYFLQGYEVACELGDVALLQKAQVLVASARAHSQIWKFRADVESASPPALGRLIAWKERGRQQGLYR
ncbi:tetratricopeptide repeat protein 29 [Etheostoma cragini]|uniref:tetratricopeptide repeat protein 29 n=1 Tax=Etheostoma cragini TaxID=417921 RepID=UPI00155EC5E4|nr:tetratricopeptide repeat protein 29 [Etheostoma cragini]